VSPIVRRSVFFATSCSMGLVSWVVCLVSQRITGKVIVLGIFFFYLVEIRENNNILTSIPKIYSSFLHDLIVFLSADI
jgi:hypothetical protein